MARGRGRLSSIDTLPEEASEDVVWANLELYANKRPIKDILAEFNARLEAKGIGPISRSAFYNSALRKAVGHRKVRDNRELFSYYGAEFTAADADKSTAVLGEYIKGVLQELLEYGAEARNTKELQELASAYKSVVSAQKISLDRQEKPPADLKDKAGEVIDTVAKAKGLSAETADAIKAQILGVGK